MLELLSNGPCTVVGTLLGLVVAFALHRFAPSIEGSIYIEAGTIGLGFVVGLLLDGLRERR